MEIATGYKELLVSHDGARFNVIVCFSQKYRGKISSEHKLKARGSQLLHTFLIAVRLLQQRQPRASSCLLLVPAGTESWFPGDTPYPQAGPGAGLLLPSRFAEERPGAQTPSSCLSLRAAELEAGSQAWRVPGVEEISTALCLPVCRTSWERPCWSQPLPTRQAWDPPSSSPQCHKQRWEPTPWGCEVPSPVQVEFWLLVQPMPARHSGSADLGKPSQGGIPTFRQGGRKK